MARRRTARKKTPARQSAPRPSRKKAPARGSATTAPAPRASATPVPRAASRESIPDEPARVEYAFDPSRQQAAPAYQPRGDFQPVVARQQSAWSNRRDMARAILNGYGMTPWQAVGIVAGSAFVTFLIVKLVAPAPAAAA